jgi:precorrin-4/cobalt-precorrin-4 C11-methyltransferase
MVCTTIVLTLAIPATPVAASGPGRFCLVSLGCGDPDNITLRAVKTIKASDILFCPEEIRSIHPDLIAGKQIHSMPSLKIHKHFQALKAGFFQGTKVEKVNDPNIERQIEDFKRIVTEAVRAGKNVSLLDFGDPCIYGPYIWTMEVLKDLDPLIVPGISSFNAANAALKTGVTFGFEAHSAVLTNAADLKDGYDGADTIERMAAARSSMVVFTMFVELDELVEKLARHYPADTPVAIVVKAGYEKDQKIIRGTLKDIVQIAAKEGDISFEHLIYVGDFLKGGAA